MREIEWDPKSACPGGMGPSGSASRTFPYGKVEDDDPAGEEGDILTTPLPSGKNIVSLGV